MSCGLWRIASIPQCLWAGTFPPPETFACAAASLYSPLVEMRIVPFVPMLEVAKVLFPFSQLARLILSSIFRCLMKLLLQVTSGCLWQLSDQGE